MERVFIGLGGNQGEVLDTLQAAIDAIAKLPDTALIACSDFYQSPAWGGIEQADFINAVLEIHTGLQPEALLQQLFAIECRHGRNRLQEQRWGPRRLDCDILLYGNRRIDNATLSVPHPRMTERAFVLLPLAEIDAELSIPGQGRLADLIAALPDQPIHILEQGHCHVRQHRH